MRISKSGGAVANYLQANGASSSGVAGTTIAEIEAGGGRQLTSIQAWGSIPNTTNTGIRVRYIFADDTDVVYSNTTGNSKFATSGFVAMQNNGSNAIFDVTPSDKYSKRIVRVVVETLGTSTVERTGGVNALEVDE